MRIAAWSIFAGLFLVSTRVSQAARITAEVLDSQGAPVEDAVVFIFSGPVARPEGPRPLYTMDQINKEFAPHVLPIEVGSRVRFPNSDNIHHHLYSFSSVKTFELPLYKGEPAQPILFDKPGVVDLGCNIHDWMNGIILVSPTPYFGKTKSDGTVVLENIPVEQDLQVAVFHERLKDVVENTLKKLRLDAQHNPTIQWTIRLKPRHQKKKHPLDYR